MNHNYHIGDKSLGMVIGAAVGIINGLMSMRSDIEKTIILAVIGSTVGYFTNAFWKYLRNKFFN